MEGLIAFSLVCNIVQIVDFSFKLVAGCREIHKTGRLSANAHVEEVALSVKSICERISLMLNSTPMQVSAEDQTLKVLAGNAVTTAHKLLTILDDLKLKVQGHRGSAIRLKIKTSWKEREIQPLRQQLATYQRLLETGLIMRLNQQHDASKVQEEQCFNELDFQLQAMITQIAQGNTKIADLVAHEGIMTRVHITHEAENLKITNQNEAKTGRSHTTAENNQMRAHQSSEAARTRSMITYESARLGNAQLIEAEATRTHVTEELYQHNLDQNRSSEHRLVLGSLLFPDIHVRQEQIKLAHRNTFEWIFNEAGGQAQPWDNYIDWLRYGDGVYWISGKAGSGKSTLMNFIYEDCRTGEALQTWSGTAQLFTPAFFFWSSGSDLQKTSLGLLRSMLWQILQNFPALTSEVRQQRQSPILTWTEKRLVSTLRTLLGKPLENARLCFFIDGLDELEGDIHDILDLISEVAASSNAKLCVSSRPELALRKAFNKTTQLKVEDLTRNDILLYVNDKLKCVSNDRLTHDLVWKADGVFLWVSLAVKDILDGFESGDNESLLLERLWRLPKEIGALYRHMLGKIDKIYEDEAKLFFRLALLNMKQNLSLLDLALVTYKGLDQLLSSQIVSAVTDELLPQSMAIETNLATRCKGLLESGGKSPYTKIDDSDVQTLLRFEENKVLFFHLIARDFLQQDEIGKAFGQMNHRIEGATRLLMIKAQLAKWKLRCSLSPIQYESRRFFRELRSSIKQIRKVEVLTGDFHQQMIKSVGSFIDNSASEMLPWIYLDIVHPLWWSTLEETYTLALRRPLSTIYRITLLSVTRGARSSCTKLVVFAIFGLHRYVLGRLDGHAAQDQHLLDCLLACMVVGVEENWRKEHASSESLNELVAFIAELLHRGANCDVVFPTDHGVMTAWRYLLAEAARMCIAHFYQKPLFLASTKTFGNLSIVCKQLACKTVDQNACADVLMLARVGGYPLSYSKYTSPSGRARAALGVSIPFPEVVAMLDKLAIPGIPLNRASQISTSTRPAYLWNLEHWKLTHCQYVDPDEGHRLFDTDCNISVAQAESLKLALEGWLSTGRDHTAGLFLSSCIREIALENIVAVEERAIDEDEDEDEEMGSHLTSQIRMRGPETGRQWLNEFNLHLSARLVDCGLKNQICY